MRKRLEYKKRYVDDYDRVIRQVLETTLDQVVQEELAA